VGNVIWKQCKSSVEDTYFAGGRRRFPGILPHLFALVSGKSCCLLANTVATDGLLRLLHVNTAGWPSLQTGTVQNSRRSARFLPTIQLRVFIRYCSYTARHPHTLYHQFIKYDNHVTSLATTCFTCKHYTRLYIYIYINSCE
jgi:hypothetical protein